MLFLLVLMALLVVCVLALLAALLHFVAPLVAVLAFLLFGLAVFALYPGSIIWAYLDAKARGKPGWALALLVALSPFLALIGWPLSLLAWIVFRPAKTSASSNPAVSAYDSAPAHP